MPKRTHGAAFTDGTAIQAVAPARPAYIKRGILAALTTEQRNEMLRIARSAPEELAAEHTHGALQQLWITIGHHCKVPKQSRWGNKYQVAARLHTFATDNLEFHRVDGYERRVPQRIAMPDPHTYVPSAIAIEVD
jgi:hypothetical protein